MKIQNISTKIISTLGNEESLIPIMIKDGVDSTSLTLKSFKEGGPVEGMDRAIDEYGTQAIWIGGIPFYKKLIDFTAYKIAKINPTVDPRVIADKEYSKWAVDNANGIINKSGESVKTALNNCLKDGGTLAKNLYKGKIIAATALTLITYFALTKSKQKKTKDTVIDEFNKSEENKNTNKKTIELNINTPEVFKDFEKISGNKVISFGGMVKNLSDAIMFNPVHNMKIIDAGITTERLACSRNKTEFCEHAIKEGSFLFFIYKFGSIIDKAIKKASNNILNKPIDLKIDVLMDEKLQEALTSGKIINDVSKLPNKSAALTDKLNFLVNNPDNIIVQAAKKSGIVQTVKDSSGKSFIDTSKFIDVAEIEALGESLLNIDKKYKISNESVTKFLNKTKMLKVGSVLTNIGISCFILGYVIPKAVYKYRELKTGTTKFHVAEDIKNEQKKEKDIQ